MSENKKKGIIGHILNTPNAVLVFIKQSRDELKKVTWPTRETTIRYTIIVIAVSIIVGLATGGVDYALQVALEAIIKAQI